MEDKKATLITGEIRENKQLVVYFILGMEYEKTDLNHVL